ncbi:MAG: FtsQ-type POTRA domain-containing protein [Thermodesulfobacteriota bacterium]
MYLGKTRLGNMGRNYYRGSMSDSGLSLMDKLMHQFWIGSLIMMIVVGVSIVLLIGYLVALSTPVFKLEDVGFKGIKKVSQAELLKKGGLDTNVNLLSLNLSEVKQNMETVPWVKQVQLQRELPNKLQVLVTEHQPLFLTLAGEDLYYLNNEGLLFKKAELKDEGSLPLLTGLTKEDWTAEGRLKSSVLNPLQTLLDELSRGKDPFYPNKLSEIHFDPDCGFTLFTLERGIRITLGREELPLRIKRLEKIWTELEKRPNALALKGISLQYGRRIIVHGLRSDASKRAQG